MKRTVYADLTIRRDTGNGVEDMLTLDSVGKGDGNGAALRFMNDTATKGLDLTLGRISASRVNGSIVRLDLAVVSDPTVSSGDDTPPLLSLISGTDGRSVTTPATSTVALGGTLTVGGNATIYGDLGIGTPDPRNRLHVFNTGPGLTIDGDQFPGFRMAVNGATVAMAQIRTDEGTALDFGTYGSSPLYFLTNSVRRMSIGANGTIGLGLAGDVGIGTHLPKRRVHILQEGSDPIDVLYLEHTGATASIMFAPNSTESWRIGQGLSVVGHVFELYDVTSARTRLLIDAKGNVGIGTTSPRDKLEVAGQIRLSPPVTDYAQNAIQLQSPSGSEEWYLHAYIDKYQYQDLAIANNLFPRVVLGAINQHFYIGTRTAHQLALSTHDNPRLVVDAIGNVGIGTTSPVARLHLVYPGDDRVGLRVQGDANDAGFDIRVGNNYAAIQAKSANFSYPSRLTINPDGGNVGIGMNPEAALHVAGHMAVGPFSSGMTGGGIEVTGPAAEVTFMRRSLASWPATPVAGDRFSWYNLDGTARLWTDRSGDVMTIDSNGNLTTRGRVLQPSSRQLKEHIVPLADALAKVAQLQGVSFTWKSDHDRGREIGFIAEDVGAVVPELVDTGHPGFLSYDRIAVLAVQAIKELSHQVTELSQKVMMLESRI